jgi:seryl-tRNA synthetase
MVKGSALFGTGQLPKFEEDLFKTRKKGSATGDAADSDLELYLIPTAEVPVTNLHADEILDGAIAARSPTRLYALLPERGRQPRADVRGLIRQHQFDKVEVVRFTTPETSAENHELLTSHAEEVLKRLGLHYRVVALCAGTSGSARRRRTISRCGCRGRRLPRDLELLELRRFPGAAREDPLPPGRRRRSLVWPTR